MALNFDEFQKVVASAQQADAIKADLKRVLKKVTGTLEILQNASIEMENLLADDYVALPKERKPHRARVPKETTLAEVGDAPSKKPGRPKK